MCVFFVKQHFWVSTLLRSHIRSSCRLPLETSRGGDRFPGGCPTESTQGNSAAVVQVVPGGVYSRPLSPPQVQHNRSKHMGVSSLDGRPGLVQTLSRELNRSNCLFLIEKMPSHLLLVRPLIMHTFVLVRRASYASRRPIGGLYTVRPPSSKVFPIAVRII